MKIYNPNNSKQSIGGGFSFYRNIQKGLTVKWVNNWQDCDIVLITGATMTNRDEMTQAKSAGKKIVMRIDNLPKDSRNRGTAFSRVLDFAKMSDFIIFQSEWAKDYVGWWLVDNGVDITNRSAIIYNGVDVDIFNNKGVVKNPNRYLYVHYNRDENKRTPEAFYLFHQAFRKNKNVELWIVGQFSPELVEYGFDFFAGERVSYLGVIEDRKQLADIMKQCQFILFPAYCEASPNTLMEAMACECEPVGLNSIGGSIEVAQIKNRSIQDMAKDYQSVFNKLLSN